MMLVPTATLSLGSILGEPLTLIGRSRAGEGTCFAIPQLKVMLDCGAPVVAWTAGHIFVSHTHSDHVHHLAQVVVQNNAMHAKNNQHQQGKRVKPTVVHLPAVAHSFVANHLRAYQEMLDNMAMEPTSKQEDGDEQDYQPPGLNLRPTVVGQEIELNANYFVRTVRCTHRIETLGYSFFKNKSSLKEEYRGLPHAELARLRVEGHDLKQVTEIPLLCFLGDTTEQVFVDHPEILEQHKLVVVECTFLDDPNAKDPAKALARAADTKHMHWKHLKPFVDAHPNTLFVLTHFSLAYNNLQIRNFFRVACPGSNVHPMLISSEIETEWEKMCAKEGKDPTDGPPPCNCHICQAAAMSQS